ncbi:MAG: hypothetical protein DRI56_13300 [Chloroflexota bacterium]|nr:MAG: hypothetical protein DRI56_13300 [Chloroflexota bacterium]
MNSMDIVLALGGGGAKGNAHLGVLRALEKEGFHIKAVAGTSAGGMAAAVYAAGFNPQEIIDILAEVKQSDLYSFGRGPALLGMQGITDTLRKFIDEETFADLRIPCALTAVDVESMREVVLKKGRVLDAVMATIAIPGVFPPKQWGEQLLVDGGVLDPVPVQIARSLAPGLPVVAVTLSPPPEKWGEFPVPKILPSTPILQPIAKLRVAQAFDVFVRSLDMGMYMLAHTRLELEKPDVIIRPQVADIGTLDKVDVAEVAARGDVAVEKALPQLHKAVNWRGKVRRWFTR